MLSSLRQKLLGELKSYVQKHLGVQLNPLPWKGGKKFPYYLQGSYDFYEMPLLGEKCLLVLPNKEVTPSAAAKHLKQIEELSGFSCIYLVPTISSHDRLRLIKYGVPFIIPDRQIFLPNIGVDWKERHSRRKVKSVNRKQLSPSAQMVVIYAMIKKETKFIPLKLAKILNYSAMTMTRAFDELESFGIGNIKFKGRERIVTFPSDPSKLWKQALPLMQSPVRQRVWLQLKAIGLKRVKKNGVLAGLSVLGELTSISAPDYPIYAVSAEVWKSLKKSRSFIIIPNSDGADIELEIWSYNPLLLGKEGTVDPYSLYLSLKECGDERIESALQRLVK